MRVATWLGLVAAGAFGWLALQAFPSFGKDHPRLALAFTALAVICLGVGAVGLLSDLANWLMPREQSDRLAQRCHREAWRLDRWLKGYPRGSDVTVLQADFEKRFRKRLSALVRDIEVGGYELGVIPFVFYSAKPAQEPTIRLLPMELNRLALNIKQGKGKEPIA